MAEVLTPDICVIGAGAGGLRVATRARALGASVVVIEKGELGGNSLNTAALPSKALVASARRAHLLATAREFGIANDQPKVNARGVFDHVHEVVAGIAPTVGIEQLRAAGIEVVTGAASFLDRQTVGVEARRITAKNFVIATGSRPVIPQIEGLDAVPFFTSETIVDNPRKLTHLVIIGGGPVGIELAQAFRRLGSEVTVVEQETPLGRFDPELAAVALRQIESESVGILPRSIVTSVQARSLGIGVVVRQASGEERSLDASHILVATGRVPDLDGLDLGKAGIRLAKKGGTSLILGPDLRTTNPRVFAIGDAAGSVQHTHAATYHADLLTRRIVHGLPARLEPNQIPAVVFTDPEIAEIGLREPEARQLGLRDFRVLRMSLAENDRARAERQSYGLVKLIVGRGDRLLGAGVVGTGAAEMMALFGLAIVNGLAIRHFRHLVTAYPSLSDVVRQLADEAARRDATSPVLLRLEALRRMLPWL